PALPPPHPAPPTLSLHDALPIFGADPALTNRWTVLGGHATAGRPTIRAERGAPRPARDRGGQPLRRRDRQDAPRSLDRRIQAARDRKSTRLNSSHRTISYADFCL